MTDAQIARSGNYSITTEHVLVVAGGEPIVLARTSGSALQARILQKYRIVRAEGQRGPWKVKTTAYFYTLEDRDGREIISYQWHPTGKGALPYPASPSR